MDLGWKFWFNILGIAVLAAIAAGVVFLIIGAAWYAWGLLGAFALICVVAIAFGWVYDRRHPERMSSDY